MQRLSALVKRHTRGPLGKYVLVGGSAFVLEIIIIVVLVHFGMRPVFAVGISFWCGLVFSFILQKVFSFGDRRTHHKILIPQILAFTALVIFNFLFTVGVTALLQDKLPVFWVRVLAVGITTIWNFYLYKTRIFNRDSPASEANITY